MYTKKWLSFQTRHADSGIGLDLESSFPSPLSPQEEQHNEEDYQLEVEVVSTGGGNNIPSGGMSEHAYSTASKLNPSKYMAGHFNFEAFLILV